MKRPRSWRAEADLDRRRHRRRARTARGAAVVAHVRFVDFLKTTVLLSAGAATALGAVTVLAAGHRSRRRCSCRSRWAGGSSPPLIGLRLGRRAETNPPIARLLAGAKATHHAARAPPERDPAQPAVAAAAVHAAGGRPGLPRSPDPGHRRGLRDHLGARLAAPGRGGGGDRGARRRVLLRRRTSPVRPMALERTPGFKALRPERVERRRHLRWHAAHAVDVLIVSLGSTAGPARGRRGAARVAAARRRERRGRRGAPRRARVRTLCSPTSTWARAARAAAARACAELTARPPRAVIYSSTTAALLWPRPGAIRFDAPSAGNRPGRHGLWQRPLERRRLRQAPLLLPWSEGGLREAPAAASRGDRALVLPVPVEPLRDRPASASARHRRDHLRRQPDEEGPRPRARGLAAGARQLAGRRARSSSSPAPRPRSSQRAGRRRPRGRRARARRARSEEYRALLRRARVFVCAPRREDYGIAQLEALADGCHARDHAARPGPTRRCRSRASSTRAWSARTSRAALRAALDDPLRRLRRPRARGARAVQPRGGRPARRRAATSAPACASFAQLRPRPRVGDVCGGQPRAPRGGDPPAHVRERARCGGRRSRSGSSTPARAAARACTSERSRRSGLALISSIVPVRAAAAKTASRSIA